MSNKVSPFRKGLLYIFLFLGVIVSVFPFYWMFVGATNPSGEIFSVPPNLLPGDYAWENFKNLNENVGIVRVIGNSLLITLTFTAISALVCTMAGYAFAKFSFALNLTIFFTSVLGMPLSK